MPTPTICQIELTGADLQIIYAALDEFPAKQTRVLYNKISAQVQAQIEAHAAAEQAASAERARAERQAIIADYLAQKEHA